MRIPAALALCISPLSAIPATCELTLVDPTTPGNSSFNQLSIGINPVVPGVPFNLQSSSNTTLSGTVLADFDVSPESAQTSEFTLREGRVTGTTLNFRKSIIFVGQVYNITIANLSAAIDTPNAPGTVNPGGLTFDAAQHDFEVDGGDVSGTVSIPTQPTQTISETFSPESSVTGTGSGTGTLELTPTGQTGSLQNYSVVVTLPVNLNDSFDFDTNAVALTASGTIKAEGTLQVPLSDYVAWTMENGIDGAPGSDDSNGDGIPNGVAWALGYDAATPATLSLPQPASNGAFEILLPAGGTRAPLTLQTSSTLGGWQDVPDSRLSNGEHPIPIGTTGTITVSTASTPREFIRLVSPE